MATQTLSTQSRLSVYRFTVRQFEKMIDAGVFPEGHNVELLAGVVVPMVKNERHDFAVGSLTKWLPPLVPAGYHYRQDLSSRAGRSWRPEPDIAVVRGDLRDYLRRASDLDRFALIIEVADSSYGTDRNWKWHRYAASGVPVYGILDLNNRRLELFTQPTGRGRSARYEQVKTFGPDDEAPVLVDGIEIGRLRVGDLLD